MIDTKMKTALRRDKHAGGHRSTFSASETKLLLSKWHLCRACVHFTWPAQLYVDSRPIQTSEQFLEKPHADLGARFRRTSANFSVSMASRLALRTNASA
jgi:hypothetical protein